MRKTFALSLGLIFGLLSLAASATQEVHSPEINMPGPTPAGKPEVVELTGKALADISDKLTVKYGLPEAQYAAYDPVSTLILVITRNGPTVYTNRDVNFLVSRKQNGGVGLFANLNGQVEERADVMKRPFVLNTMASLKEPIVYQSPNEKYRVSVFIDPACAYCHKLHSEMQTYLDAGITLAYYPFPIFGEFSEKALIRIWSLPEDQRADKVTEVEEFTMSHHDEMGKKSPDALLDELGLHKADAKAKSIIEEGKAAGHGIGLSGTPGIVLKNGQVIGGYLPAQELLNVLKSMN